MRTIWQLLLVTMVLGAGPAAGASDYFSGYAFSPGADRIDLGVQPMAYPLAFISSVMQRDRSLRAALAKGGARLAVHPFRKGNDMVALVGEGRIEMAFLGDMPTINAAVRTPIVIVGLGKRNFSSVVSRDYGRIEQLRGRKIGYSAGSSSHFVLLQGLKGAGLREQDVQLVALEPSAMPDALERGEVDAFSAWEPTPSISLARNPANRAIYRGMSTDWVVFSREFAEQRPQQAELLVAAYVRAINWMRASQDNLERAAGWVEADGRAFTGEASRATRAQAVSIVRKDLLDVPGAPAVPSRVDGAPPLSREFAFLKAQGKVPADTDEACIRTPFSYELMRTVQREPARFRVFAYDYDH